MEKNYFKVWTNRGICGYKALELSFELPIWSIIPILIAGNTIVFKPSEYSTKTGQLIFDLFLNAGFPEGVFNIITGDGSVGKFLVRDTNINAIDFTGSQNAGKNIYESNSTKLKKINLELGGSDFAIVCDNSDIDLAVDGLLWGHFLMRDRFVFQQKKY